MRKKIWFCMIVCFLLTATTASFAAQSEIIAQFQLPQKAVHSMDEKSWNKLYERVVEKLPEEKFAPDRILFKLKGSPSVHLWTFDPKLDMAQMLAHMKSLPEVEFCQPDYIYTLRPYHITPLSEALGVNRTANIDEPNPSQPNDPWYSRQAHLKFIGMERLFQEYGSGLERLIPKGHDPYIHIVDSGGGCEHPDLNRANIIPKKDFVDWDDDPCSSPNGMDSHGEFVAAIMCAVSNNDHGGAGICPPNTKLAIWRVFDKNGNAFTSTINVALSQIILESNGLGNEIVNMSFGGPTEDPFLSFFISIGSASQELFGKNITFVGSSGNAGDSTPNYPATLEKVMSVGASEFPMIETGEVSRARYSSYGKVDIVAPVGSFNQDNDQNGTADGIFVEGRIYDENGKKPTAYGAYLFEGTSGAAPIVSATAALAINMGIYGPVAIRKVITETAGDILAPGFDQETGWGLVRAETAVLSTDDSIPVFGSFGQNSYVCAVEPDKDTCEVTVGYNVRPGEHETYLWYSYGDNSFINLGNKEITNNKVITAPLGTRVWVMLIYYPDRIDDINWGEPRVFASTVVTAKTASQ